MRVRTTICQVLAIAVLLAGCSLSPIPSVTAEPVVVVSASTSSGALTAVIGEAHIATPLEQVTITNEATGAQVVVEASAAGSFLGWVQASAGDQLSVGTGASVIVAAVPLAETAGAPGVPVEVEIDVSADAIEVTGRIPDFDVNTTAVVATVLETVRVGVDASGRFAASLDVGDDGRVAVVATKGESVSAAQQVLAPDEGSSDDADGGDDETSNEGTDADDAGPDSGDDNETDDSGSGAEGGQSDGSEDGG